MKENDQILIGEYVLTLVESSENRCRINVAGLMTLTFEEAFKESLLQQALNDYLVLYSRSVLNRFVTIEAVTVKDEVFVRSTFNLLNANSYKIVRTPKLDTKILADMLREIADKIEKS